MGWDGGVGKTILIQKPCLSRFILGWGGGRWKNKFEPKALLVTSLYSLLWDGVGVGGCRKNDFDSKDWLVMFHHGMGRGALKEQV